MGLMGETSQRWLKKRIREILRQVLRHSRPGRQMTCKKVKKGALTGEKKLVSGQMLTSKLVIYLWSVISQVPLTSGKGPKSPPIH